MKNLRIHLFQFPTVAGQAGETLSKLQVQLRSFRGRAGDWLVFPEMWPSGFTLADAERLKKENAACLAWLQSFAKKRSLYLSGSMLELSGSQAYNRAYIIDPRGRLAASYRKIHLFEHGGEHLRFSPGRKPCLFPTPWGPIGLAICYDLRFPELFRLLSRRGAVVFLIPSAWPRERIDHFRSLLQARAIENQAYVIGVNKVGPGFHREPVRYGGHSAAFDPWGRCLLEMNARTGSARIELDLDYLRKVRRQYPFLKSRVLG